MHNFMSACTLTVPICSAPALGGVTRVPFVGGMAVFTRLAVDRPSSDLRLSFHTIPSRFQAETTVVFQVVGHDIGPQEHIGFALEGDVSGLDLMGGDQLTNLVRQGLSIAIDVDLSRIQNLTIVVRQILIFSKNLVHT